MAKGRPRISRTPEEQRQFEIETKRKKTARALEYMRQHPEKRLEYAIRRKQKTSQGKSRDESNRIRRKNQALDIVAGENDLNIIAEFNHINDYLCLEKYGEFLEINDYCQERQITGAEVIEKMKNKELTCVSNLGRGWVRL